MAEQKPSEQDENANRAETNRGIELVDDHLVRIAANLAGRRLKNRHSLSCQSQSPTVAKRVKKKGAAIARSALFLSNRQPYSFSVSSGTILNKSPTSP